MKPGRGEGWSGSARLDSYLEGFHAGAAAGLAHRSTALSAYRLISSANTRSRRPGVRPIRSRHRFDPQTIECLLRNALHGHRVNRLVARGFEQALGVGAIGFVARHA